MFDGTFDTTDKEEQLRIILEVLRTKFRNIATGAISGDYIDHLEDLLLDEEQKVFLLRDTPTNYLFKFSIPKKTKSLNLWFNIAVGLFEVPYITKITYTYELPFLELPLSAKIVKEKKTSMIYFSHENEHLENKLNSRLPLINKLNNYFVIESNIGGHELHLNSLFSTSNSNKKTYIMVSNLSVFINNFEIHEAKTIDLINEIYDAIM